MIGPKIHITHKHNAKDPRVPKAARFNNKALAHLGTEFTLAFVLEADRIVVAASVVSEGDQYCYQTGREIASRRLTDYLVTGDNHEFIYIYSYTQLLGAELDQVLGYAVRGVLKDTFIAANLEAIKLTEADLSISYVKERLRKLVQS